MIVGQRDGAAMPPRHRAHQAEPEPVAGRAAARLQPHEAVEHAFAIGLGDARVRDRRPRSARGRRAAPTADRDLAAAAVFERVVEQVRDRLRQQVAVALGSSSPGALSNRSAKPFSSATGSYSSTAAPTIAARSSRSPRRRPAPASASAMLSSALNVASSRSASSIAARIASLWAAPSCGPSSASSSRARSRASGVFRSCATLSVTSRIAGHQPLDLVEHAVQIGGELVELVIGAGAAAPDPTDCRP